MSETFQETYERVASIWNQEDFSKEALFESFGVPTDDTLITELSITFGEGLREGIAKYMEVMTADGVPLMEAGAAAVRMTVLDIMLIGMLTGRERDRLHESTT